MTISRPPSRRSALLLFALLAMGASRADTARTPAYEIEAVVDPEERRLVGAIRFIYRNDSDAPEASFYLFAYPNHYSVPQAGINDEIFDRVYPDGVSLGDLAIDRVVVQGRPADFVFAWEPSLPERTLVRVDLPAPLPPGAQAAVEVLYRVRIPERFGSFGAFDGRICLNGGWHPYLPARDAAGQWRLHDPPPPARFEVRLRVKGSGEVLLNGRHHETVAGRIDPIEETVGGTHLSLVVAPRFHRFRHECRRERITYYQSDLRPADADRLLQTLHLAIDYLPEVPERPDPWEIVLVQVPLRRDLAIPSEGMTLLSDRFFELFFLGRQYHLGPVAEAVYTTSIRPLLRETEDPSDTLWASEAVAYVHARGFYDAMRRGPENVRGIFVPFSVFPAIDRLLQAPRFPFVRAFFGGFYEMDPLREDVTRFNRGALPGRVLMEKIRDLLGDEAVASIADAALTDRRPVRSLAEEHHGGGLDWFFAQWRFPYPRVNYRLVETRRTVLPDGRVSTTVRVAREGEPVRQPVEVRVKELLGEEARGTWAGDADEGTVDLVTERSPFSTRVDPRNRLNETTRVDNQSPPSFKILFNRLRARIDLNGRDHEGEVGSTIVLNNDYRNRYTFGLFTRQEQDGATVGYWRSFGREIDITEYTQGAGVGLGLTALDPDFATQRSGRLNDEGEVTSITASYGIGTKETRRNPILAVSGGIWGQVGEKVLGSDFRFWRTNVFGEAVLPVVADRHILAARGQFGAADREGTPTQLLFDVGGFRGIRGLRRGTFLGHLLWQATAEYRLILLDHLDWSLGSLAWVRRVQTATYFEIGNVADRGEDLFVREDLLYGAGAGLRVHLDLLGVFPNVLRFDVAWRLDEADGPLFYIGGGQSF